MWAGRQTYPATAKARDVKTEIIEQKVIDTQKTGYLIGSPQSDTNLPNNGGGGGKKKGKRKRRAFA